MLSGLTGSYNPFFVNWGENCDDQVRQMDQAYGPERRDDRTV